MPKEKLPAKNPTEPGYTIKSMTASWGRKSSVSVNFNSEAAQLMVSQTVEFAEGTDQKTVDQARKKLLTNIQTFVEEEIAVDLREMLS